MSETHTPGPWEVYMDRVVCNVAHRGMHGALQSEVCTLRNGTNPVANARLIAAAPDLAEALRDLAVFVETTAHHDVEVVRNARAALAKAGL